MKRTVLDITKKLYRSNNRVRLEPFDLNDTDYYIFKKNGNTIADVLYEMTDVDAKDSVRVTINNVFISNDDFLIESDSSSITIKFIKNNITYTLDSEDTIILNSSIS